MVQTTDCMIDCNGETRWCAGDRRGPWGGGGGQHVRMVAIIMIQTTDCMIDCNGEARWCAGDNETRSNQPFKRL